MDSVTEFVEEGVTKLTRVKAMATRNGANIADYDDSIDTAEDNTVATNTVKSDNIDDIPDELSDETSPTPSTVNGQSASSSSSAGMSLDELGEIGFDDSRDEHERAKLDAPTGDWEKDERWKVEKRVYEGDCMPGDIDPVGRTVFIITGKPKTRTANNIDYTPMLFVRASPDIRYKVDKPNEVDNAYKLFLQSKDVYLEIAKEKPTKLRQLVSMWEEDNFIIRTMNGDNGPICVGVKPKVARRR